MAGMRVATIQAQTTSVHAISARTGVRIEFIMEKPPNPYRRL